MSLFSLRVMREGQHYFGLLASSFNVPFFSFVVFFQTCGCVCVGVFSFSLTFFVFSRVGPFRSSGGLMGKCGRGDEGESADFPLSLSTEELHGIVSFGFLLCFFFCAAPVVFFLFSLSGVVRPCPLVSHTFLFFFFSLLFLRLLPLVTTAIRLCCHRSPLLSLPSSLPPPLSAPSSSTHFSKITCLFVFFSFCLLKSRETFGGGFPSSCPLFLPSRRAPKTATTTKKGVSCKVEQTNETFVLCVCAHARMHGGVTTTHTIWMPKREPT
jgi:hypothetical protein